ncbi:MAG: DUF3299 domain-containing protein [Gemmatimonadales bacterium]|nr:DUF3299 domain-containing protein [Gemmatimonadales bacterium]
MRDACVLLLLALTSIPHARLHAWAPPSTTPSASPPVRPSARLANGEPPTLTWRLLAGLDIATGTPSDTLRKLNGQVVRIPGFIVPLDDGLREGNEFLLVPYYGACIHTPPPPPNQMVMVTMADRKPVALDLFQAVTIEGTLRITESDSPYGLVGYDLQAVRLLPYGKAAR